MNLAPLNITVAERFRQIVDNTDAFLRQVFVPGTSNVQFQVEGVLFHARYIPDGDHINLQFWAKLGYLPFSVESAKRRDILITILEGVRHRMNTIFGVNKENEIIVTQTVAVSSIQPPGFIFVPLTAFLQEALPVIRLIGECLQA